MTYLVKTPSTIQQLFPKAIWKKHTSKAIYLTFDDGPIPTVTEWVLNLLKEYDAKATFFCIGKNVNKHSNIYERILREGHAVGNHTMNHENGWKTNNEAYFSSINECAQFVDSKLFRPPYGKITPKQARELEKEYKIVMWDVM